MGEMGLHEATRLIQDIISDPKCDIMEPDQLQSVLRLAEKGMPGYNKKVVDIIATTMAKYGITVVDMDTRDSAEEIYKYLWGMDIIEDLYHLPHVDEIRVNGPRHVYYQEKGKSKQYHDATFKDNEHIRKIVNRLLGEQKAVDVSNPGCVCKTLDGTRLTVLDSPLTTNPSIAMRKHGTFNISDENYVESGTMNEKIQEMLSILIKGRSNILVCGDSNVGKTTLIRWGVKYLQPKLRIITVEINAELSLGEWYPDRDIVAIESHPELGWDMKKCFRTVLILSPDVIIVGEARGEGEASQMINACRSGHHGTMGTIHVYSAQEAVSTLATMAMEEGRKLPIGLLENQVASAFNIIIQMYGNSITGVKKIEKIVEVWKGKNGPEFQELCVWVPSDDDFEKGHWEFPNDISDNLSSKLFRFGVAKKEIAKIKSGLQ